MPGKATKAEVLKRVEAVLELRLAGADFASIREYAAAPTDPGGQQLAPWGVSDSQLWRYIAAADRLCAKRCDARGKHRLALHLARRERLYAHALDMGDIRTALAVARDQAELEGLYRRQLELTGKDDGPIEFIELGSADAPPDRATDTP